MTEPTRADIEREFPDWDISNDHPDQLWHARRRHGAALTVLGESEQDLLDQMRAKERRLEAERPEGWR